MDTSRRGFLRLATTGAAWWWAARGAKAVPDARKGATRDPALAAALAIHRATRNTRFGAIGARLRMARAARRSSKPYPGRPRERLPTPEWDGGRPLFEVARRITPEPFSGEAITRAELARLLFLTNGVTGHARGVALRTAPSAGALYAGEVYVVAARVEGLLPGVYSYFVPGHALVRLPGGSGDAAWRELSAALPHPDEAAGAAVAVLLGNVFGRYRVRYANRGYRYALIDSGHIGENLRLAAAEAGLAERAPLRFEDDRLGSLLGVDGREEAVCALHLVGRPGEMKSGAKTEAPGALVERGGFPDGATGSPTDAYHESTKLVRADAVAPGAEESRADAIAALADGSRSGGGAGLDGAPDATVHDAIRVRRSTRRFEPTPMARADLLHILELARGISALARTRGLDLHVVAHRVDGLAPGHYRYDPAAHALDALRPGALAEPLVEAALGQRPSGDAAAAVVGVARLAEATAHGGARAYRHLLLEAGAAAQRVYLAAEAQGLTARNLAAYYDDELDALLGLDGEREVSVHLTAVGVGD